MNLADKAQMEGSAFKIYGDHPAYLRSFFVGGRLPKLGDRVEMVCVESSEKWVCLKWRVVNEKQRID